MNEKFGDLDKRSDKLKSLVRACFRALSIGEFQQKYDELYHADYAVWSYLNGIDKQHWASYMFINSGLSTHGTVNNNAAECEAARLKKTAREQLSLLEVFISFLESISKAWVKAQKEVAQWKSFDNYFVPKVMNLLVSYEPTVGNDSNHSIQFYSVTETSHGTIFSVKHLINPSRMDGHTVDIVKRACTCKRWLDFLIPCVHAYAVAKFFNIPSQTVLFEWTSPIYAVENVIEAYSRPFVLPSMSDVETQSELLPQDHAEKPARKRGNQPKPQKRFASKGETSSVVPAFKKSKE